MRRSTTLLALLASSLFGFGEIDAHRYIADIKYLTSKQLKGRASGSPELDKAAQYIAKEFHKAGLRPVNGSSYLQPFAVSVKATLGPKNRFGYALNGHLTELNAGESFTPFSLSSSASVRGKVVFAGYGITAPEYNYDDYAGVDARGKIVLLLRHEPQEFENNSVFEGRVYTEHSQLLSKALNARAHGAIAILYVNDTANHGSDLLEKFVSLPGPADAVSRSYKSRVSMSIAGSSRRGKTSRSTQEEIDRTLSSESFELPEDLIVDINTDVQHTSRDVSNVVGYVPGATDEYVIIGAHYDHLGLGEQYSLAPRRSARFIRGRTITRRARRRVWRSRDTSVLIRNPLVAFCSSHSPARNGPAWSTHYVNHPCLPLNRAALMINMDMIGRIRDRKVMVGGAPEGSPFRRILETLGPQHDLDLDLSDTSVYGSSDHTSFKARQVPTLFFFSGLHADYHRPSDTWEKIDPDSTVRLLKLIADLTMIAGTPLGKPQFAYNIFQRFSTASTSAETSMIIPITMPHE